MRRRSIYTGLVLGLCLWGLLLPLPAAAEDVREAGVPGMTIRADRMSHQAAGDLLTASGSVAITWQEMTLTADEVQLDRTRNILTARGNVSMVKAGDTMRGDSLLLDTETGRAEMENGRIFMAQGNFHIGGSRIARTGDEQYALRDGCLTTCDETIPSWKIGAEELDVTVEEYATGSNVVFYVKDLPVFYVPYLMLPVKRERQSGLLFPRFGRSSKRGEFLELPVYWAISPSQEATVTLDLQTKRGVGVGLDYRYLRSRTSEGVFGGYLIHDENENKVRGQLLQFHREDLTDTLSLTSSINLTSDRTYLQDYGDASGDYNRQFYDSRVVLTQRWQSWLAGAQAIYTQDFSSGSNSGTLQRAPELFVYGVRQAVPSLPRVWFDLDTELTSYYREKGMQGQRAVVTPRLSTSQSLFDGRLTATLRGGVQVRGYTTTDAAPDVREDAVVAIPEASAELSSAFSRMYDGPLFGMARLRHEVVPSVSYHYAPDRSQTAYPFYDQDDRTPHLNLLQFSLASHLGGKLSRGAGQQGADTYRHLQTIRFSQGYSLNGTRQPLLTETDTTGRWSEATLESETWLHPIFRLLVDARYNHSLRRISATALGGDLVDGAGNSMGASYRMTRDQVEYLEGRMTLAALKPVYLGYLSRYSFDKRDFLESYATVEYRHQCWSVMLVWRERPNDRSWTVNFNLAGLFSSSKSPVAGRTP